MLACALAYSMDIAMLIFQSRFVAKRSCSKRDFGETHAAKTKNEIGKLKIMLTSVCPGPRTTIGRRAAVCHFRGGSTTWARCQAATPRRSPPDISRGMQWAGKQALQHRLSFVAPIQQIRLVFIGFVTAMRMWPGPMLPRCLVQGCQAARDIFLQER